MAAKSYTSQPKATWQDVEANDAMIVALCRRWIPEEWDDAAQEVRLHVWRKISSFRGESAFKTWLYRLTVNRCKEILRNRKASIRIPMYAQHSLDQLQEDENFDVPSAERDSLSVAIDRQRLRAIRQSKVAPGYKVLLLQRLHGMSLEEIAAVNGIDIGSVKSSLNKGKKRMSAALTI